VKSGLHKATTGIQTANRVTLAHFLASVTCCNLCFIVTSLSSPTAWRVDSRRVLS